MTMPIHNLMLLFCVSLSFANLLDAKVLNRNPTFEKGKQGWFGKREVVEVEVNGQVESVLRLTPKLIGHKSFAPNTFKSSQYDQLQVTMSYRAKDLKMDSLMIQVYAQGPDLHKEYRLNLHSSKDWIVKSIRLPGFEWHDRISLRFFCENFFEGEIQFKEIFISH